MAEIRRNACLAFIDVVLFGTGWLCASSFTPSSLHNTEKDVCVAHFRIHINVRTYNQSAEIFVQIIYQTLMYVTNSPTMDSMGTGV